MKKRWLKLVYFFLLFFSFTVNSASENVVLINDADWPPFFFQGKADKPTGIAKEVLLLCQQAAGVQFKFEYIPLKRMQRYIESGQIDTNIYSYKPEREQWLLFGKEPLFVASYRPVVKVDSELKIAQLADFLPLRVGHLAGLKYSNDYRQRVLEQKSDDSLAIANSNYALIEMLLKDRIDVFVNTKETVLWNAQEMGVGNSFTILNYDIQTANYYFTLAKNSPRITDKAALIQRIDSCIRQLKRSGQYQAILAQYGLQYDD